MPTILDQDLYDKVKKEADQKFEKPSAYKSGWLVKTYKERGGRYADDKKPKNLKRWFKEEWGSIGKEGQYPTYRPFKRVSAKTPLTANEIDPKQAKEQIKLKQEIKGSANLPKFEGRPTASGIATTPPSQTDRYEIKPYTYHQAKLLGVKVFPSDNPKYKIEVYDAKTGEFLFYGGDPEYADFPTYTETHGLEYAKRRRKLYHIRHAHEPRGSRGDIIGRLLW